MPIYKAPVEDVNFLLNDVFQIDRYDNLPGFSDASADGREAILGEAAKRAEEVLQPLNRVGDLEGCTRHDDGSVTTPKGFKQAFKQVAEGGWLGLSAPTEYGGQGLPVTLSQAVTEFQCGANMAFSMYGGLTMGATAALIVHGKPEQKALFVPKMVGGEWTGTMNLTEPQCGTDLGLLRTKAVKQADGSYKITGTKIFISSGGHVRDDERGAAWGRRAGARAIRSGLSERGSLCPRSPAGPFADRSEGAGQAGRSDHRASRCPSHAAYDKGLQRGGARDGDLDRVEERRGASLQRSKGSPRGRRS